MTNLVLTPQQLAARSVAELAALSPGKKLELSRQIDEAFDFLKKVKAKFEASVELAYGEPLKATRADAQKDFGTVHVADGILRVTSDIPKRASWDQQKLGEIARRIAAAGERVEDFIDVEFSIPESRFNALPPAWREQFEPARTVKSGKPTFRLSLRNED